MYIGRYVCGCPISFSALPSQPVLFLGCDASSRNRKRCLCMPFFTVTFTKGRQKGCAGPRTLALPSALLTQLSLVIDLFSFCVLGFVLRNFPFSMLFFFPLSSSGKRKLWVGYLKELWKDLPGFDCLCARFLLKVRPVFGWHWDNWKVSFSYCSSLCP